MMGRVVEPLALDTPLPTPNGWTTVGNLAPGDEVFGSDGKPVAIRFVTPIYQNRDCLRVTFDDGEEIVTDANHGWTLRSTHRKSSKVREITATSAELSAMLKWHTLSMGTVEREGIEASLTVDPYFLGVWLGDGSTTDSSIACASGATSDEMMDYLNEALPAYEQIKVHNAATCDVLRPTRPDFLCRGGHDWTHDRMKNGVDRHGQPKFTCGECQRMKSRDHARIFLPSTREMLRDLGVLGNKHIPDIYMHSSAEQRFSLLQGLMDSDGSIDEKGHASFSNVNERLARQVHELVVSLGYKARIRRYDYPNRGKPAYSVQFIPNAERPVVRLSSKVNRLKDLPPVRRFVRSVEPVNSVPVRCVGIDNEDHLFVVGTHGTLTHNTSNGWDPAEDSVAQRTYNASLIRHDIFRHHPQAPNSLSFTNKAERRRILRYVYAGCPWVDIESINSEAEELITVDPAEAERFYGNRIVAGLGSWLRDEMIDAHIREDILVPEGSAIAIGFDGSDTDDWTALRCETQDGHRFTPTYGPNRRPAYWNPAEWGGTVPRGEVRACVDELNRRYRIRRMFCDPRDWRTEIGEWALLIGEDVVLEWSTYRIDAMFLSLQRARNDLKAGRTTLDGDKVAREHLLNARMVAKPGDKYILGKPDRHRKIDIAIADTLAHEAAGDLHALGPDAWRPRSNNLTRAVGRGRSY